MQTYVINNPVATNKRGNRKGKHKNRLPTQKMNILGQEMNIKFTSRRNYSIPVSKSYTVFSQTVFCCLSIIHQKDQLVKNK